MVVPNNRLRLMFLRLFRDISRQLAGQISFTVFPVFAMALRVFILSLIRLIAEAGSADQVKIVAGVQKVLAARRSLDRVR